MNSDVKKIVWEEDGEVKIAHGEVDHIDEDWVYFNGVHGPLVLNKQNVIAIK